MSTVARLVLVTEPEELDSEELVDDEVDSSAPTVRCPVFPAPESGVKLRVETVVSTNRLDSMEFEIRQLIATVSTLTETIARQERTIGRLESALVVARADTQFPRPPKVPAFAAETRRPAKGA